MSSFCIRMSYHILHPQYHDEIHNDAQSVCRFVRRFAGGVRSERIGQPQWPRTTASDGLEHMVRVWVGVRGGFGGRSNNTIRAGGRASLP